MASTTELLRRIPGSGARKQAKPPQEATKAKKPLSAAGLLSNLFTSGLLLTSGLIILAPSGIGIAYLVRWINSQDADHTFRISRSF